MAPPPTESAWARATLARVLDGRPPPGAERVGVGHGVLGALYRVRTPGRSYVAKLLDTDDPVVRGLDPFRREAATYAWLAGHTDAVGSAVPAFYGAAAAAGGAGALLLEDLGARGATVADALRGLSVAEVTSALVAAARVHRLGLRDARAAPARPPHDWLLTPTAGALVRIVHRAIEEAVPRLTEDLGLSEGDVAGLAGLREPDVRALLRAVAEEPVLFGVCHGDLWSSNIMFAGPASGRRAVLIDWQFTMWGSPLIDAAFLIASSLAPEDQQRHGPAVLEAYHAALVDGSDLQGAYSIRDCRADYAVARAYGLLMTVANTGTFLRTSSRAHAPRLARRMRYAIAQGRRDGYLA